MSKKNLLQESDIRRMMKFANIGALSDTFVEKLNEGSYNEEEADEAMGADEVHGMAPHEAAMDEMGDMMPEAEEADHDAAEEPAGDEDDLDLDLEDEPADDAPAGDVQGALAGVQTVLKAMQAGFREMGMEEAADAIQVEMADEPDTDAPMDDEPPTDDEPGLEAAADDVMAPEAGASADDDEPPMPMEEGSYDEREEMEEGLEEELEENDDLFNEVVRRVARRLMNK